MVWWERDCCVIFFCARLFSGRGASRPPRGRAGPPSQHKFRPPERGTSRFSAASARAARLLSTQIPSPSTCLQTPPFHPARLPVRISVRQPARPPVRSSFRGCVCLCHCVPASVNGSSRGANEARKFPQLGVNIPNSGRCWYGISFCLVVLECGWLGYFCLSVGVFLFVDAIVVIVVVYNHSPPPTPRAVIN